MDWQLPLFIPFVWNLRHFFSRKTSIIYLERISQAQIFVNYWLDNEQKKEAVWFCDSRIFQFYLTLGCIAYSISYQCLSCKVSSFTTFLLFLSPSETELGPLSLCDSRKSDQGVKYNRLHLPIFPSCIKHQRDSRILIVLFIANFTEMLNEHSVHSDKFLDKLIAWTEESAVFSVNYFSCLIYFFPTAKASLFLFL